MMSEDGRKNLIRFTVLLIDISGGGVTDDRATAAEPAGQDGSDWMSYARLPRGPPPLPHLRKSSGKPHHFQVPTDAENHLPPPRSPGCPHPAPDSLLISPA